MTPILDALKLRTHPFRPLKDAQGLPFADPELLLKTLDPLQDPRLIDFYFDHYNWQGSIRQISKRSAFVTFPSQADMQKQGPMMVLITGSDNTGRESLRNLILHKIATQFGKPFQFSATLDSLNIADNIRTVATVFYYSYNSEEKTPTNEALKAPFDGETGDKDVGSKNNYSRLFQIWRNIVLPVCKRPLVLLVDGGDNHDLWRAIYDSTSHLFRFIIVMTKNEPHANACFNGLEGKNRVLIKAKPLGPEPAKTYLASRLAEERYGPVIPLGDLTPFSQKALDVLYEEGSKFKPGDQIEWSIGWLNETFSAVMDDHLAILDARLEALQKQGKDVADLTPDELVIGVEVVRAARKRLNQS